ncbi:hypothetical protein D9758_009478 [Tetrapyrgos nigripes]|uniref:Uncharacterized protein n=1 Tax=Tetrapyrgos nigripes TaxID=182062 RepID=A0A8H5LFN8_9AGAR|nr:hypothetical protein D9758_009478 [Tetrapyrgos nigripes]
MPVSEVTQKMENIHLTADDNEVTRKMKNMHLTADDINKFPMTEELNSFLNLDYMIAHPPWKDIPWIYYPSKQYDHRPPLFVYGFGLTTEELFQYAVDEGLSRGKSYEEILQDATAAGSASTRALRHMQANYKARGMMTFERAASYHANIVLTFWDNYTTSVPRYEEVNDVIDTMEKDWGPPRWYLVNEQDLRLRDYRLKLLTT